MENSKVELYRVRLIRGKLMGTTSERKWEYDTKVNRLAFISTGAYDLKLSELIGLFEAMKLPEDIKIDKFHTHSADFLKGSPFGIESSICKMGYQSVQGGHSWFGKKEEYDGTQVTAEKAFYLETKSDIERLRVMLWNESKEPTLQLTQSKEFSDWRKGTLGYNINSIPLEWWH